MKPDPLRCLPSVSDLNSSNMPLETSMTAVLHVAFWAADFTDASEAAAAASRRCGRPSIRVEVSSRSFSHPWRNGRQQRNLRCRAHPSACGLPHGWALMAAEMQLVE